MKNENVIAPDRRFDGPIEGPKPEENQRAKSNLNDPEPIPASSFEEPTAETIRVRKVNPTLLTRDDGSSFATGEVDATPAEFERWSRMKLVVKV